MVLKIHGCCLVCFYAFSNFYRLGLHNKNSMFALANLRWFSYDDQRGNGWLGVRGVKGTWVFFGASYMFSKLLPIRFILQQQQQQDRVAFASLRWFGCGYWKCVFVGFLTGYIGCVLLLSA